MRKYIIIIYFIILNLNFILIISQADDMVPVEQIDLSKLDDINDAKTMNSMVDKIANKITSCMEKGKSNEQCLCENLDKLKIFQNVLKELLIKHAEWRDKVIYYKDENAISNNLSFMGLQNQSELIDKLSCE